MTYYPVIISDVGSYAEVHIIINNFCFTPLFKLYNDDIVFIVCVRTNYNEIHALGCLWNIILDSYLNIVINLINVDDIPHKHH